MRTAMQIAQTVEPLEGESQAGQQPYHEQAAFVVVANMLEPIAIFSIVEAFIFYLPATLGHGVQATTVNLLRGEIRQPVSLHHRAIRFVLAIAHHAHGFPLEAFPRIEVVSVPQLHTIIAVVKHQMGRLGAEASPRGFNNSGRFSLSRATTGHPASPAACKKGAVANSPSTTT